MTKRAKPTLRGQPPREFSFIRGMTLYQVRLGKLAHRRLVKTPVDEPQKLPHNSGNE